MLHFQLYDIRAMKELESFRGHRKDVTGWCLLTVCSYILFSYPISDWECRHSVPLLYFFCVAVSNILGSIKGSVRLPPDLVLIGMFLLHAYSIFADTN